MFYNKSTGKNTSNSAPSIGSGGIQKAPEPWVSKYRPRTVDDVAHQDEVVRALKKSLDGGALPHLLFYGPPGTGKTSTILAIAMDLYGPDLIKDRVLELNASDERGIEIVRTKIKNFASFTVNNTTVAGKQVPSFKLIILDEADSMTQDAQAALRRTIENTSKTTRFCLLCNYITRIIEPLSSRCAKFRFKPLKSEAMGERLKYIADQEGVNLANESTLDAIHTVSQGDMRKAITFMQSAHRFYASKSITDANIYDISGSVEPKTLELFINSCKSGDFYKVRHLVERVMALGYPASQIISQLFDIVVQPSIHFNNIQRTKIAIKIGQIDRNLVDGSDEFLQLFDLGAYMMKCFDEMEMN
ncbi:replication factor C subunit [Cavenderia fasciculata]|uniref:Replication factor C subunit n=1 Tax=Cavenderia fasciculata TaxID=261658 RepID=F4PZ01_CACFS|nr:replication factor C subunit [Cavenderia fasciculata]EGG19030.1 replication factor C subunit [Cavenderia fasciculata]|eukprot:XP_004366663.1 replication factor C subunit [Cavenderia fasciculata]